MKPETQGYLGRADRHRALAYSLLAPAQAGLLTPPPLDWALVAGFYAALHYVQAYVWETQHHRAATHDDLRDTIKRTYQLRSIEFQYRQLLDRSWQARYLHEFSVTLQDANGLLTRNLEPIRQLVLNALGLPI
jgi:hypothetical protein